jgi:hypothetical protein
MDDESRRIWVKNIALKIYSLPILTLGLSAKFRWIKWFLRIA